MCFVQKDRGQGQNLAGFPRVSQHPEPGWVGWDSGSHGTCSGYSVGTYGKMGPDYFLPQISQRKKPMLYVTVFEIVDAGQ